MFRRDFVLWGVILDPRVQKSEVEQRCRFVCKWCSYSKVNIRPFSRVAVDAAVIFFFSCFLMPHDLYMSSAVRRGCVFVLHAQDLTPSGALPSSSLVQRKRVKWKWKRKWWRVKAQRLLCGVPTSAVIECISASLKPRGQRPVCPSSKERVWSLEGTQARALISEWDALARII